ncbi:putative spermidine/putrescine transport system permease protein [Gibbsiella quercinecans]|uniref:ABC transporter permease n=2 Tax=Gibbsiella TaxID=929812 RepID=A0A250AWY3_9GAMM|nr:ABC transporter permease [Gibbsiella quercinecans]ATA18212.1 ABC transporter permease [Gibbsiella quercinecans]RLM06781.1 ABC transporter permease [Gibbsiella quercinecans]RLM12938.1 ABC transporter permease [Gibbsiella quercinecans]TCT92554.1 putative spermidine/putrescine transport system permease protein [Gibbsiella quercinecans]
MTKNPTFLPWFIIPAMLTALGLIVAMFTVMQFSVRAYIPGALDVGGFTLANFNSLFKTVYANAFINTVMLSAKTAVFGLLMSYPLAYALVRTRTAWIKSVILIVAITPLFLGEVVRTYSWIIVLGNSGFLNSLLLSIGLIDKPIQFMFTQSGVVVALVHVTMPIMVLMLATALSHINPDYEKAAMSLGAGPVRTLLTVTIPLSIPGIVSSLTTAFAWTFSAFATPQLIGGGRVSTVATLVYQLGFSSMNFPFAAALSIAGLVLTILLLASLKRMTRFLNEMGGH